MKIHDVSQENNVKAKVQIIGFNIMLELMIMN